MSHVNITENYIWIIHDQIGEGAMGKVYKCCSKVSFGDMLSLVNT